MKITEQTTLAELEVARASLGVIGIIIEVDRDRAVGLSAIVFSHRDFARGVGFTVAAAIEHGFAQLRERVGGSFPQRGDR